MLYTRKGDKGTTKVLDSKERFSKASELAEALGSLDELNSFLGLCKVKAQGVQAKAVKGGSPDTKKVSREGGLLLGRKRVQTSEILREVQQNLFTTQARLAGAKKRISRSKVMRLEKLTDAIEKELSPITSFTLAGGTEVSALLDIARTLARRTERRVVEVNDAGVRKVGAQTLAYLNRLSSLLFALARLSNHKSGITEESPDYR